MGNADNFFLIIHYAGDTWQVVGRADEYIVSGRRIYSK